MRVLLGLAALSQLALLASAQQQLSLSLPSGLSPSNALPVTNGVTALATIYVYQTNTQLANVISNISNPGNLNTGAVQTSNGNWFVNVLFATTTLIWTVTTNAYTAQSQYRFGGNTIAGGSLAWVCDPCCSGTPNQNAGLTTSCNTQYGPAYTFGGVQNTITSGNYAGFACANFQRQYTYTNLQVGATNSFAVQLFDRNSSPGPDSVSYSFSITRGGPPVIGDPQIYGLQGQDFQVHGIPDEIFNMVTYPNLQVNARFVYLSSAECHDNFTACFAHPGTYIGEEGIRLGNDKIHVKAGSFKKGLTVAVNGQRVSSGKHSVKLGSVNVMSHRRVVVNTPIMTLTISNSDKFLNQETTLHDQKLLALGQERRVLADAEQFHPEVPLHGLQGQTWRNVEYPSGLEYEGSINDYHVVDGNLYGTEFVFNQFKL